MVFLCTSMYSEAQPFIKQLNLKKDGSSHKFQIFKSNEVILIVTGIGKVKAAIAVTYLLSKYETNDCDLLINIGVCGTTNKNIDIGTAFFCNKIIDNDTKRTFFPDMLFRHFFQEASVETCSLIVDKYNMKFEGQLVDMEACGIYQAASVFLQPHQVFFIKIISDYLNVEKLTKDMVTKLVKDKALKVINFIHNIKNNFLFDKNLFTYKEQAVINTIAQNLKLSSTMKNQLKQILKYYKLQHSDFMNALNMYTSLECNSKNEGKMYFGEIKQKLI